MGRFKNPSATRAGCKNLLLGSVSLLACGIVLARTPAAHAQDFPGSSNVTYNSNGANFVVNPGVDLTGNPAVAVTVTTHTIANHGTLASSLTALMNASTIGTLSNSGSISGKVGVSNADSDSFIQTFTNSGKILGVGTSALAVANFGTIAALTNSGTISGSGGDGIANYKSIGVLQNALGGTISGAIIGVFSDNNIGTLINAGIITGEGDTGVESSGTIGLLANNKDGTISGKSTGIDNQGFVGTLSNSGLVSGGTQDGISNFAQISTLENIGQGLINGTIGINNQGLISTLSNGSTATISGVKYGIGNGGIIGTLTNAGTISGNAGINNALGASFATLTNESTGTISGENYGISNAGIIGTLTNAGLITANASTNSYGIENGGTISLLTNSGTISSSSTAIKNLYGTIATLTNSGTISGFGYGIANSGSIGILANYDGGTITGAGDIAINNVGIINTISNATGATITGGYFAGIHNTQGGIIGTLTNAGLITGPKYGIQNDSSNISLLSNAGTIIGYDTGINNDSGTIGTLINYGTISGVSHGVNNFTPGSISSLTNSGIISGAVNAINNTGIIATLTNAASGTLVAATSDINNNSGGYIGTLTNKGSIVGASIAIANYSSIGTLSNSGLIIGDSTGIYNKGTIATLTNAGTISGGSYGIINGLVPKIAEPSIDEISNTPTVFVAPPSFIGTLTNSGLISGYTAGIYNGTGGTIGILTNAGLISALDNGIDNEGGTIATLTNTGTILNIGGKGYAPAGIVNGSGSIGTLDNIGLISGEAGIRNGSIFGGMNGATISELDNTGTILALFPGIYNSGLIQTLTNGGYIAGGMKYAGIYNTDGGTITSLSNTAKGTIIGTTSGISNGNAGFIGTLTNAGVIAASERAGIYNSSEIAVIENTGTIGGGYDSAGNFDLAYFGIDNDYGGNIGQLTNDNLIIGSGEAIGNIGTITSLTNTGTIFGSITGIYNQIGQIQTLSNSGLITGFDSGIENNGGTITTLTNNATGTISGQTAIYGSGGGLGTLTNSGLIAGNVDVRNQDLNIIGGAGSIFGTLSGGNIYLSAGDNLNFLSGNQILTDNVSGITSDGGHGDNIGTLTNSGTLQIGYPGEPATISVAGDYAQTPDGTLNVIVTPAASSEMTITGTASLSGGVDYIFAPGTYTPKTYDYLTAGSITGTFTSENYGTAPVSDVSTTYEGDPTADLVIGSGFSLPMVVNPSDSSIFSDQTQALAEATQASDASLLGMAATGGAAASPACEGQAALNPGATNGNNANIASAIAAELCNHGGWIQADGSLGHVDGNEGAAAYNANTAGFLAGIDSLFGSAGTRLGFAIGYDETYLSDKSGGSGDMGTTRVALYGSQPIGPVLLSAVIGYGHAGNDTTRSTAVGGIKEKNDLGIVSGALQASTALPLQNFTVIPAAGIRFVNVEAASFTEAPGANNAFALTGRTKNFNSVQPYATVELTTSYLTPSGMSFAPQATLGLQEEAGNLGAATNLYAADGTYFASAHTSTAPLAAIIGAGLTATKSNLSFYINYTGLIAGNWNTQSGTAGLRVTF